MPNKKSSSPVSAFRRIRAALLLFLMIGVVGVVGLVHADQYDNQINALQAQNANTQSEVNGLQAQASSYQDAINLLGQQISATENAIAANQAKQAQVTQQITEAENNIATQKGLLGNVIESMYVNGQMSTIEELATSKSLSDYVDQVENTTAIQNKVDDLIHQISALETELQGQKNQLDVLVKTEQQQNSQLVSAQNQQQQLLAMNQSQQNTYNQQIQSNQSQIAVLRQEQIAANRRLDSSGQLVTSGSCGGSYPATASGSYGPWGCAYAHSSDFQPGCSYYDNWGMCNRECVSYTAWMVYNTYNINTIGFGNANQWPASARAAGIPTGSTPKVGSVAIYSGGAYGHAMWVVGVSGDQIHVYSYNDNYDGNFYDHWVSAAGLTYIYFGG